MLLDSPQHDGFTKALHLWTGQWLARKSKGKIAGLKTSTLGRYLWGQEITESQMIQKGKVSKIPCGFTKKS